MPRQRTSHWELAERGCSNPSIPCLGDSTRICLQVLTRTCCVQVIAAPLLGMLADKCGFKFPLLLGVSFTCLGNLLYALVFVFHDGDGAGWRMMIVSRVIMGAGSAALITGASVHTSV